MSTRRTCVALSLAFPLLLASTMASALPDPKVTITYSAAVVDGGEYWLETSGTPLGAFDFRARLCAGCEMFSGGVVDLTVNAPDDEVYFVIEYTADGSGDIIDGPVELVDAYFYQNFDAFGSTIFGDATISTDVLIELTSIGTGTLAGSTITWDADSYYASTLGQVDCTGVICAAAGTWPVVSDPDADPNDDNPAQVDLPTFTVFSNVDEADFVVSDNGTPVDFTDDLVATDPGTGLTAYNTWYGQEIDRVPEPSRMLLLVSGLLGLAAVGHARHAKRRAPRCG